MRHELPVGIGDPFVLAVVDGKLHVMVSDLDRSYFGRSGDSGDQVGQIDNFRAIFGRSYAAEPDELVEQLRADEAIAAADTLLLTVPNQLGVDYNVHLLDSVLRHVAPERRRIRISAVMLYCAEGTAQHRIPADAAARPRDRWHFTILFCADTCTKL